MKSYKSSAGESIEHEQLEGTRAVESSEYKQKEHKFLVIFFSFGT